MKILAPTRHIILCTREGVSLLVGLEAYLKY